MTFFLLGCSIGTLFITIIACFFDGYYKKIYKKIYEYIIQNINYSKKIGEWYNKFNNISCGFNFVNILQSYFILINTYKLKKPTKVGKIILKKSLPRLYKLLNNYKKAKNFIKDDDIIKPSGFEDIVNKSIYDVIDLINSDISIIKNKKLIEITDDIKKFYK